MSDKLTRDASARLREIKATRRPDVWWREGNYGAARAWLLFVGPSPGGDNPDGRRWPAKRVRPSHKTLFTDPLSWPGYKVPIMSLVQRVAGLPWNKSGRIYAWANFDYVNCTDERTVEDRHMRAGFPHVLHILMTAQPRVIIPVTVRSRLLLQELLEKEGASHEPGRDFRVRGYPFLGEVRKLTGLAGLAAKGVGEAFIVKLPMHPRRLGLRADGVGKTIHRILIAHGAISSRLGGKTGMSPLAASDSR